MNRAPLRNVLVIPFLFCAFAITGCSSITVATQSGRPTAAHPTTSTPAPPTAAPATRTSHLSPPWAGLPMRTYANLKKHILGDPINVAFEGTRADILAAFHKIGWVRADPLSARDDARLAEAAIRHANYPSAPVSNLYLFGRPEDFAVEHEVNSVYKRDHARFWDTGRRDATTNRELFIGDASRDIAIEILRTKHGLPKGTTHRIASDVDQERNRIVSLMRDKGLAATTVMEPGMGPTSNAENGSGDHFHTDGHVALIVLKAS